MHGSFIPISDVLQARATRGGVARGRGIFYRSSSLWKRLVCIPTNPGHANG